MKNKLFTLLIALVATISSLSAWDYTTVKIGDLYYDLDATKGVAEVASENGYSRYFGFISVKDKSVSDWDTVPAKYISEATCPSNAYWKGLKRIRVCADEDCIYYMLVFDPAKMLSHTDMDGMHIYINADNSAETGGFWDLFTPDYLGDVDLMLEGGFWDENGNEVSYTPYVSTWAGPLNGGEWQWSLGTIYPSMSASQFVNDSTIEGKLIKKYLPWNKWADTITIGFDIYQNFGAVGLLPQGSSPDGISLGKADKLLVNVFTRSENISFVDDSVAIPASVVYNDATYKVTSIGEYAFFKCKELISIQLSKNLTNIGDNAFEGCNVWNIYYDGTLHEWCNKAWGPFSSGYALYIGDVLQTTVTIPNGVTAVKERTFYGCNSIKHVVLPASIEDIEDRAFYCPNIETITCYGMNPPSVMNISIWHSFPINMPASTIIYVPAEYIEAYKADEFWGLYDVRPLSGLAIDNPATNDQTPMTNKIIKDNRILILRGEKVYTVTGQQVK